MTDRWMVIDRVIGYVRSRSSVPCASRRRAPTAPRVRASVIA
jgi:hypothetical protein